MNGQEIFERAAEKYADCGTYSDAGRIENNSESSTFKTYFVRPNLFKYEFQHEHGERTGGVIWSDGNEYFSSLNHELDHVPIERYSDLLTTIGDVAGYASYLVPMLLMPGYAGPNALVNAGPYELVEHTSIADRSSKRLRSTNSEFPFQVDLLIDSLGYKIRKMFVEFSPNAKFEVVFNEATFDREIPEDIFKV